MTNLSKTARFKAGVAPMVLGAAMLSTPAFAQDEVASASVSQPAIVVTGSRITNPNLEQSSPVQVVGEEEIDLRQATNAEELIGDLPGIAPGINSGVNNGSAGYSSLNLRNLDARRNLVLLDGTRLVPSSLTSLTDLNIIPVALVERVEVVTGGASSVYGADAITGVANFVLRRDFSGLDAAVTAGITERGDGERIRADLTLGANFDDGRGNATLSIGYQDVNPVLQSGRIYSQNALFIDGSFVGSGTSTPTRVTSDIDLINADWDALDPEDRANAGFGTNQLNPDGTAFTGTYNTFNYAPFNYFQTPLERFNIFGSARYEVTPNIEVYARGMFTKSTVRLQLAPSGLFGDTYQLPLNNPFLTNLMRQQICAGQGYIQVPNPYYVDDVTTPDEPPMINGPDRIIDTATCDAAGAATSSTDPDYLEVPVTINRRLVEMGPRQTTYTTNQFQVWGGVRGSITDNIDYDAYISYGESDRSQSNVNWGLKSRVQQALRASSTTTCEDGSNGCFPINLFGAAPGTNIDPAAIAFINQPAGNTVRTSLGVANASIFGDLSDVGWWTETPIGFAVGVEYRDYAASQVSDVSFGTQDEVLGTGAPSPSYSGGYDVIEGFAELIVPIVENVPGFYNLTAEGGIRYSDYSNTGTSTTWKVGGTWEPIEGYRIRGIYQHAVRSPNIAELFAPVVTGLTALTIDPCQGTNPIGNTTLTNICIAQGAPAASIGSIPEPSAAQINATTGGNPNLDVETANSWTVGVIITPPSIPGLAITADYYNIRVTGAITTPTPGDIVDPCFVDNLASACALIVRNPLNGSLNGGGDTPGLLLQLTNQGTLETSGIDLRVAYQMPTSFGSISWDFNGNWVDHLLFQASPTAINRECVGYFSINCEPLQPEFTFNLRTTVSIEDIVDISLLWTWLDGLTYEPAAGDADDYIDDYTSIPSYSYFDLTARFHATETLTVTAGVYNLFDKDPPLVSSFIGSSTYNSGNTYPATYDPLGRRYSITARLQF